jgi:hypothetical protein
MPVSPNFGRYVDDEESVLKVLRGIQSPTCQSRFRRNRRCRFLLPRHPTQNLATETTPILQVAKVTFNNSSASTGFSVDLIRRELRMISAFEV